VYLLYLNLTYYINVTNAGYSTASNLGKYRFEIKMHKLKITHP